MDSIHQVYMALGFIGISLVLIRWDKKFAGPAAVLYATVCVYVLFGIRNPARTARVNLGPFRVLWRAVSFWDGIHIRSRGQLRIIVLNILLFVPFGYLLPVLWKKAGRWWRTVLLGFVVSFVVELLQLITRLGMFDVDDVINNTIGAGVGYLLYLVLLQTESGAGNGTQKDTKA